MQEAIRIKAVCPEMIVCQMLLRPYSIYASRRYYKKEVANDATSDALVNGRFSCSCELNFVAL
jgi:hypothetical protein